MGKKGQFVPVSTLGDLTELLNHNCRVLEKRLTKLTRRNRSIAVLAIAAFGYAVWAEMERRKQEEEVYQLSVRVKKLEYGEGEYYDAMVDAAVADISKYGDFEWFVSDDPYVKVEDDTPPWFSAGEPYENDATPFDVR